MRQAGFVEAWSTERLPFEPKAQWLKDFRRELRDAVRALEPSGDELLAATYGSPDSTRCDVENVLIYNVGPAAFTAATRNGLRLERSMVTPAAPVPVDGEARHYHRYALTAASEGFAYWRIGRTLARWSCTWSPGDLPTASSVWRLLRRGEAEVTKPIQPTARFGAKVEITVSPRESALVLTSTMKPLLDGVISAFHSYDGTVPSEILERLSRSLDEAQSTIEGWLTDPHQAALGKRRLAWPRGMGVQWNPADDLCQAIDIRRVANAPQPTIIGVLFAIEAVRHVPT